MNDKHARKSPVFTPGKRWEARPDARLYESELTALVRKMLEDPQIREDQQWAWRRWRSGDNAIKLD
ncbi:MAG: hypothetical protein IT530_11840 [Burkholderiales bacterium]|nr:hypothetical protein [Burkholderiales bacterium]